MIRILSEQMEDMGRTCADSFTDRLTAFVRAELGGRAGAVTRDEIAALAERARAHGFTLQSTMATFVLTARLLGDGFEDRVPAARDLLAGDDPEELRAFALERLAVALVSPPPPEEEDVT
jgi:hypothetical protein